MPSDLLVIVPTRTRPAQCVRLIESFEKTADDATLLFVTDSDDDSYDGMDWRGHRHAVLDPPATCLAQKLNNAVAGVIDYSGYIMWSGDDHVFVTEHWDTLMLGTLAEMGGSGWVYPANGRRADVPETWLVSSDITRELGWFANPKLSHYYLDNSIAELAKRASLIRYCPAALIEHRHYSVPGGDERDALYSQTEQKFGESDARAFNAWRAGTEIAVDVSRLRRKFNPDVSWVLEKEA